ncbi:Uma2 family endonuclease [Candidatus Woesearchaeota archaeon]|nr:Uma2 family endonuclease [Candidatus Woesearchaeota archaeon]
MIPIATRASNPVLPAESVPVPVWRLRVDQYHQMIDTGVLGEDDPVELLTGWLVPKMPKNPAHRLATQLLRDWIAACLPPGWFVDSQEPLTTLDSEPEPDVMIVRGVRRDYGHRHPGPSEVPLVIEVADTSLQRDRGIKQALYARAGIPEYWIVNLPERHIEIYRLPEGQSVYLAPQVLKTDADLTLFLSGKPLGSLPVAQLLP